MTFTDDFVPVEDVDLEGPTYPTAFGIELTPKVQGIALAVLGIGAAAFLLFRVVAPLQTEKNEIQARIDEKENTLANQEESLRQIEEVQAELDRVLTQREGIYSLLGDPTSLDTLLLDTNQQIEKSNASIAGAIAGDLSQAQSAILTSIGLSQPQVDRIIQEFANDPVAQRQAFTSELFTFDPVGLSGPVGDEYGPELNGKLERQIVSVSFRGLFNQTQNILYNLERLEPLLIIRDFNQEFADVPEGIEATEEDFNRLGIRPLQTSFTMEVLVPLGDPREPPEPPAPEPPAEGEEGAGGAEGAEEAAEES
jgi:type IV pilus assembly protein PilO